MAHLNLRLEKKSRLNEFGSQYYLTKEKERERESTHSQDNRYVWNGLLGIFMRVLSHSNRSDIFVSDCVSY